MKKLSKSLVLLFVTFIFVACTGLFSPKGKVAVKLPGIAGSRAAVNYSPEDIEYYEVLLQSEKLVDKKTAAPGTEIVFSEIEQGDYSITISGYKKDADKTVLVAQGTKDVQIIGGLTSNVEITLSLLQKPEIPESPETPDEPGSTDTPSEWDLKPSDFNGIERKDNTPIKEIYLTFTDEYYAVGKTNNFFNTTLPNKSFKAEVLYDDNKSYTFSSLANIRAFQFTLPCNDEDIPYVGQQVPVTCAYLDTASGSKNETVTACIKPLTISVLYNTVIPSVSFVSGSATISSINIPAYTGSANFSVNRSYEQIEYPVYGT
ncbi:MAG: hypothetical protein HUK25_00160, partial [Treponema sp.]|nr:hypothetical protein [Treponema sp.]